VTNFKKKSFPKKSFGSRSFSRAGGTSERATERFQATCSECKALCEVPFKPNGKKPVFCRDCFKGNAESMPYAGKNNHRSGEIRANESFSMQFELLNAKLDRLIKAVEGASR
jgi:CxxC-x17-CxxC domain-containing protein